MSQPLPAACPAGGTPVWGGWRKRADEHELHIVRGCLLLSPLRCADDKYSQSKVVRMVITDHRLLFDESKEDDWSQLRGGQWLLGIEEAKPAKDVPEWAAGISVRCRDLATYVVIVKLRQKQELLDACQRLSKGRAPLSARSCFTHPAAPGFYTHPHMGQGPTQGPFRYNPSVELARLEKGTKECQFKLSRCNAGYKICATYPEEVILPTKLLDELVRDNAKFRSKSRFPMVSWFNPATGACIARSSQPATGVAGKVAEMTQNIAGRMAKIVGKKDSGESSPRFERLMDHDEGDSSIIGLFAAQRSRVTSGGREVKLSIADARPAVNAGANTLRGGGTEGSAFSECELTFLNIENIHAMRKALAEFRKCMTQPQGEAGKAAWSAYSERLQGGKCSWFGHLELILQGALFCAKRVLGGESVVVHCSDGWDRTSQLVALANVLLDPYFRTIEGFVVCVEKDWLQPGHKFADRNGLHDDNLRHPDEESPVFLQFLECLAHLADRYPRAFEYTPAFLGFVLDESYSGDNINFLCNNISDRLQQRPGRCLWREILSTTQEEREGKRWLNPLYVPPLGPPTDPAAVALLEVPRPESFVFQHPLYGRWRQSVEPHLPPPLPVLLLEEVWRLRSGARHGAISPGRRSPVRCPLGHDDQKPERTRTRSSHSDASDPPPSAAPARLLRTRKAPPGDADGRTSL
eukprot:Hpha_TRINITY_DN9930_c0_g1::TRINITY_DN9930_c0_g1_i1::g.140604::m.140604